MKKLILFAVLAAMAYPAGAVTIHIPADQPTIQAGIDASSTGDTVLVAPGSYFETLVYPSHRVTVLSSDGPDVTFLGAAPSDEISSFSIPDMALDSDTGSMATDHGFNVIIASYIDRGSSFEGFTVTGVHGAEAIIYLTSAPYFEVKNNRFINNDAYDVIRCVNFGPTIITHNLIANSATGNAIVSNSEMCDFINNTVYGGERGLAIYGKSSTIMNNIVVGVAWYAIWDPDISTVVSYNDFWNNGVNGDPGLGGFSLDPLFSDALSGDFHLQPLSPCIDAGDPRPVHNDPDHTRCDMGAFPFLSSGPVACAVNLASEDITHVVSHAPAIEWVFYAPSGGLQAAFELEIGTDQDWSVAEMWSTGIVNTSETSAVYGGLPLEDGQVYSLRIRVSDGVEWGAWSQRGFRMNSVPTQPEPDYPVSQEVTGCYNLFLRVANSGDAEGDNLLYDFEVYANPQLTQLVFSEYSIQEQSDYTISGLLPDLDIGEEYWWRARTFDGYEYSEWCPSESFITRGPQAILVPDDQATIQEAIDIAYHGDTVLVAPGTYYENVNYEGKQIVLMSSIGAAATIIEGTISKTAVVTLAAGEGSGAVLDGFTVRNPSGWGVYCDGSSPVIQNCNITGCVASSEGGGIWCVNSGATIRNNTIHDNRAYKAAGVGGYGTQTLEISGNVIYNNSSLAGVGIGFRAGTENVRIHHNLVYGNVGWNENACAISVAGANNELINNTVVMNESNGILVIDGTGVTVLNNIVALNTYSGLLPGLAVYDYNDVWGNGSGNIYGPNGMSVDPLFVASEGNDYRLSLGSPCIDAGHPDAIYNDPDGSRNDLGAYPMGDLLPMAADINLAPDEMTNVVNHTPTIQWNFYDAVGSQVAYEVEVGTDPHWSPGNLWATGEIFSSDNFVTYAGAPLLDGDTYYLRIRVNNGNGWGDWSPRTFRMNSTPTVPVLLFPVDMQLMLTETVYLKVANSSDAENDNLLYDFEVYSDEEPPNLVTSQYGLAEQPEFTVWDPVPGLEDECQYWWRARSFDGYEYSEWSGAETFLTTNRGPISVLVPEDSSTIQAAINGALDGDTVLVSPGTYPEYVDFLGKAIVLTSVGGRDVTFISLPEPPSSPALDLSAPIDSTGAAPMVDAHEPQAAVTFAAGEPETSVLEGFTITNPAGRGIYCSGSKPVIRYCDISYCNTGEETDGGGILCVQSAAKIQYNLIHHNQCGKTGAGIGGSGSVLIEISNNLIYDNESPHGPAVGFFAPASNVNIHHNVVWDNTSESDGMGAVYINGTDSWIVNNTIVSNTTGITIYSDGGAGVEILNNIVVSNDESGIVPSVAYVDYNDAWDNPAANDPGPNGISLDPLFVNANGGDFALLEGSPCIDAGHPDPIYNDADGTRNDIGAYHFGQVIGCCLLRGDIDHGGDITPLDIVYFVNWLWHEGAVPPCMDEADVNGDGSVDPADCLHLANYMWNSGPPPVPCP